MQFHLSYVSRKKFFQTLTLIAIVAALPITAFLVQQQQNYLQHASDYSANNTIIPFSFDLQNKMNFVGFPAIPMDDLGNNLTAKKFLQKYTHGQCDSISSPDSSQGSMTAYYSDPAKAEQNTLTYLSGAKAYFIHCNLPSSTLKVNLTGERIDGTTLVKEIGQQPTSISLPHNFQCLEKQACTPQIFLETIERLSTDKTFSAFPLVCHQIQGFDYPSQQLITYTNSSVASNTQFATTPIQEEKGYVINCSRLN